MSKFLVVVYLVGWLGVCVAYFVMDKTGVLPVWVINASMPIYCALSGLVGGVMYLLRSVYINACVRQSWSDVWIPWYLVRPITSLLSGFVAWVFLSAGLLVLGADTGRMDGVAGFFALAFVAGLNVDQFLARIEGIAASTWGIKESRQRNGD